MPTYVWIIIVLSAVIVAYWAGFATCALFANRRIMEARWELRRASDGMHETPTRKGR